MWKKMLSFEEFMGNKMFFFIFVDNDFIIIN